MIPFRSVFRHTPWLVALAAFSLTTASCERKPAAEELGGVPPTIDTHSAAESLTDANILATVIAANTGDIQSAQLAEPAAQSPAIRSFATMMIALHSASNAQVSALATKLALSPQEDAVSLAITAHGDSVRTAMGALHGAAFDRAYIHNEVGLHAAYLELLANSLVPAATHSELKALLLASRPAVEAHLAQARRVQSDLAN